MVGVYVCVYMHVCACVYIHTLLGMLFCIKTSKSLMRSAPLRPTISTPFPTSHSIITGFGNSCSFYPRNQSTSYLLSDVLSSLEENLSGMA